MRLGRDAIAGLVLFALGGFLLALTEGLPKPALVPIGPAFYPRLLIVLLMGLATLLVVQGLRARPVPSRGPAPAYGLVAAAFAVVALYVGLMPVLGFRIATGLFVAGFQILLAPPRAPPDWIRVAAVALGTAAATWLVFEHELAVLLPRGRLTGF